MREKKSIKRAFALILAAVLAFTTFSSDITAIAADKPAPQKLSVSTETKDGIGLTKSVKLNADGTVDVTFKVDGSNATQYINQTANTDIVLVLDTSKSMVHYNSSKKTYYDDATSKLSQAKNAAKSFINQVFATEGVNDTNVRIGVVTFWKDSKVVANLTNRTGKQGLLNKIDAIESNESTNITAGIRAANNLFGDTDNHKIVVVMTDGEANYAYNLVTRNYTETFELNTEPGVMVPVLSFGNTLTTSFYVTPPSGQKAWASTGWYKNSNNNAVESEYASRIVGTPGEGNQGYYEYETTTTKTISDRTVYKKDSDGKYYFNRSKSKGKYTYTNEVPSQYANATYIEDYGDSEAYMYYYYANNGSYTYVPHGDVYSYWYTATNYYDLTETVRVDVTYHFQTSFNDIKYPAVIEANNGKRAGEKFYTVAYGTEEKDAVWAMKNIASLDSESNLPLFYESAEDSISNIFASIAESVADDIAAAKGTQLVDTLPSYMGFYVDGSGKYVISSTGDANVSDASISGKDLTWNLANYDLSKDKSYSITVKCAIDLTSMINEYAAEHHISADEVRALMAEEKISFNLNKEVVLSYTDISGNEVINDDLKADANISLSNVPYTTYKTYEYDVNYVVDGTPIDTQDVHYGYNGETITYSDAILNTEVTNQYPAASYDYEVDKESLTVSDSKKEAFTVNITSKFVDVTFVSLTPTGEATVSTQSVKIGTAATDPFATEETKTRYEALYNEKMSADEATAAFNYTFSGWASDGKNESIANITKSGTFTAQYANATKKTFTVTFDTSAANGAEWANAVPAVTGVEYGNTVAEPSNVIDVEKLPEDVASYSVTWKLGDAEFDFATQIKSNITLVAEYTPNYKYYTVEFKDWAGDELATVANIKHGTIIPNFASYTLERDVQDEYVKIFEGWKANEDLTGDTITASTVVTGNMILYPDYTQVSNKYTVTWKFLANNATETSKTVTAVYEGSASMPSDVVLDDFWYQGTTYTFSHWALVDNDGSSYVIDERNAAVTSAVSDVTFEAVYTTEVDVYEFTFYYKDASGNDAEPVVREAHYGDSVTPPETPDYEVYDDNGDLVVKVSQNGWNNTDYLHVTQNGSARATEITTDFFVIEFVDSITGSSLWRGSVESGETPVAPEYTTESINGNVKLVATGWDSEIAPATENKTYSTDVTTYYWCETVHKIGDIEIEDRYNGEWVEAGTAYSTYDSIENYPYVTSDDKKYDKVDGSLSLTASGSNDLVVISLTECPKGTITFYNYDGTTSLNSFTGYIGDAFEGTIPSVTKPANTFATVYGVDTWYSAAVNGTKVSTEGLVYKTDAQNFFAVKTETARTFTLAFFNEDGTEVTNTVDGLSSKREINAAHDRAKAPTKEPTHTEIFNGYWGGIYTVVDGTTSTVSIERWDYANDDSTAVDFGTKANFRSETRKYRVDFFMYAGDQRPVHTDWVVYEGTAPGPGDILIALRLKNNDQFTGWDKDLGPITDNTKITAKTSKKHTITYKNYEGSTLYRETYPKFGRSSYDTTLLTAEAVGARKTFALTYAFKFEGWKLDNEVIKAGEVVSLEDGDVVVTAKFEDNIPGQFFVRLPWLGIPTEIQGHESEEYSQGIAITSESFDYNRFYAGEYRYFGRYTNEDVAKVVKADGAPSYEAFTEIDSTLPDFSEKNITASINWYVAKIQNDGIHIDGYPSFAHDTVEISAVYDGTNLVEALYNQLLEKADGVMVSYDDFVEAFGPEIINKTNLTATITGTFVIGGEEPVQEPIRPVADLVPTLRAVRAAVPAQTISVEMPISLSITARPAVITIHGAAKNDGDVDPRFTYDITGEVAADPISVTLSRARGEAPGSYPITATVVASDNYDVRVIGANLRIDPVEENEPYNPPTEEEPPTGGEGGGQITPPPVNPPAAGETPTQVAEVQELPTITLTENEVPMAAAPAEGKQGMKIEDEDVPMAVLSQCYIHWVILAIALVYAIYATLRAVQNKKELEDNEELAKNN